MNLIDVIVIAVVIIFLVIGLFGKLWKQVVNMIMMLVSIPISYLISGKLLETDQGAKIIAKIKAIDLIQQIAAASPSFESVIDGSARMLLFYIVGIVDFLIFGLLGLLIYFIFNTALSKGKATKGLYMFGLPSAISAFVIAIFVISPVMVCSPVLTQANEYYQSSSTKNAALAKILDSSAKNVTTSQVCAQGIKLLNTGKVPFLTYTSTITDDEGKQVTSTYNFYSDMKDTGLILPTVLSSINSVKNLTTGGVDMTASTGNNSISNAITTFGDILGNLDTMRTNLSSDGHLRKIIAEVLKYYLETYPTSDKVSDGLTFLQNAKKNGYLDNFDYENASLKDDLLPIIIQSYIDSQESKYAFLSYVDVTKYTYEELTSELTKIPEFLKIFSSASNMSSEDIKNLLENSILGKSIIDGMLIDYGYDNATINSSTLDYNKESQTISEILAYSNDSSMLDTAKVIDDLTSSKLMAAVINSYSKTDSPLKVQVTSLQKAAITLGIEAKVTSGTITQKECNTYLSVFVVSD